MSRDLLIEKFDPDYINKYGYIMWRNKKGELHSIGDRPAVIYPNGIMFWFKNGVIHRNEDKPAVIYASGEKKWYVNGKLVKETCYKNT